MKARFAGLAIVALLGASASCSERREPIAAPDLSQGPALGDLAGPHFSDWSAPVNLGAPVNTASAEQTPAMSKDGLSMYFHCIACPENIGGSDIWVAERASIDDPWAPPQNLGTTVNTTVGESSPALSRDGHLLVFNSSRPGGFGGQDLWVARRQHKRDNFGWSAPVNMGPGVNTASDENSAEFAEDANGNVILYLTSNRAGGLGSEDIYYVTLQPDGTFGVPVNVVAVNSPFRDSGPAIRKDGLEMFFGSERPGGLGGLDIWVSSRVSQSADWSTPTNLGAPINSAANDGGQSLAFAGDVLFFHTANRAGNIGGPGFDIWYVTREKIRGRPN